MKLHWIQHVPFEGLGYIEKLALLKGYEISVTKVYEPGYSFPEIDGIDLLVVMGGPMGVYDTDIHPWLKTEKEFMKKAVESETRILGICLGAQLVADVMGAKVEKNHEKEIGWFRLIPDRDYNGKLSGIFDESPEVFHWHGDTFGIPDGCELVCSSEACLNQAFEYKGRIVGLQFHLETTQDSAKALVDNCGEEINEPGKFIQAEKEIMAEAPKYTKINNIMGMVFERIMNEE